MTQPAPERARHALTGDVKCLRCGAMNLPENHICGRCGANLPLVYDEEGKVTDWKRDPYYQSVFKKQGGAPPLDPQKVRWFLRIGVILFAVFAALCILRHR